MDLKRTGLSVRAERAVLVGIVLPGEDHSEEALEELKNLARTAGARIVGELVQKRTQPDPATFIGMGKVDDLRSMCSREDADVVVLDHDLRPAQVRNLEKATDLKVIDRTELILDIFATRAKTGQAKLQVELAQLEYALPRLRKMWSHLSRVEGGIGVRGPGEQQLETDRRLARRRITELKRSLQKIVARRQRQVQSRSGMINVSMVGYTNAGKSTLMNLLTGSNFLVEDRLFATLDTRTRKWAMDGRLEVLLSDTVGFIRSIPHHLVASFHATLEEIQFADVLLHVVDASSPYPSRQIEAVEVVLDEIGCSEKPCVMVFNKMDQARDSVDLATAGQGRPSAFLSALRGDGIDGLVGALEEAFDGFTRRVSIVAPAGAERIVSLTRQCGGLLSVEYGNERTNIEARLRAQDAQRLAALDDVMVTFL